MQTETNEIQEKKGKPVQRLRRRPRPSFDEDDLAAPGILDPAVEARLKSERVQEMLRAMPEWQLAPGGKAINRVREFPSAEVATLYGSFATGFARVQGLPVSLHIAGGRLMLTLHACRNRGRLVDLTEPVLGFAQQLG
jgi:hypothetical protein